MARSYKAGTPEQERVGRPAAPPPRWDDALVSLFPLLLLPSSLLGFALQGNPRLDLDILTSTLSQFPVIRTQLRTTGLRGSGTGVFIGVAGSVYGALGVAQAVQNLMNVAWAVPRNRRPNTVQRELVATTLPHRTSPDCSSGAGGGREGRGKGAPPPGG